MAALVIISVRALHLYLVLKAVKIIKVSKMKNQQNYQNCENETFKITAKKKEGKTDTSE